MSTIIGNDGLEGLPSLQDICDLYRAIVNDTFNGGAGQINTNTSPWIKPFLNSAIRDLYSDLRLIGDMRVVKDGYILRGLPALDKADPAVQTMLSYSGYFNGTGMDSDFVLPADLMWVLKLWQRSSGTDGPFHPLYEASSGLGGCFQGDCFSAYEVRGQNELWFDGALLPVDLRIRYIATFPNIVTDDIDFSSTYVPIQDCTNAVAFKMVAYYAQRLSPEEFPLAEQQANKFTKKLRDESIRNSQNKEYQRLPFLGYPGDAWL